MHILNRILDSRAAGIQLTSLLCILFSLSMSTAAAAQERVEVELKALSGIPVGQLGEHIGQAAWGIEFAGTYHPRGIPFALGGHLAVANFGRESRRDILGSLPGSSPNETYSYDIFLFHLFARFELMKTGIKPYLDLLLGMKCFVPFRSRRTVRLRFRSSTMPPMPAIVATSPTRYQSSMMIKNPWR